MVILGDCDSWIDEQGHFGIAMHPGREPIGSPIGRFEFFFCTMVLCGGCTTEYYVIDKEAIENTYGAGFHVFPINFSPHQREPLLALVSQKRDVNISGNPQVTSRIFDDPCPRCGSKLFTKDELLVRSIGRERNNYHKYAPMKEGDAVWTCPRCKAGSIEYKGAGTY